MSLIDELRKLQGGNGSSSVGFSMEEKAEICFQRWVVNVPVKDIASLIGKSHSRVTEIASGRDFNRYSDKQLVAFKSAIHSRFALAGLKYTGDFTKNHSWKKLPPVAPAAPATDK